MGVKSISAAEYVRRKEEFVLIDVRTGEEWKEGHEEQAMHIELASIGERMGKIPKKPLALICHSGARSAYACMLLSGAGFDACNIEGGMNALLREKNRR
ncbi:rhodanese-like domain-containing protein [Candidatus Micrarchaeota archaeon]|nr:rhodanese-like domain-containing protein [Candidatus Micrarchaeota archaeon]